MVSAVEPGFWLSLVAVAYAYVGFPALVATVGLLRRKRVRKHPVTPRISLIIAAYNEEANIAARLENALALDYPGEKLEIIVASDGSSDATDEIVCRYAPRVRLLRLPRGGKLRALNAAVPEAGGEILVFSDADIDCERQALRKLAENFADPEVGGVAGNKLCRVGGDGESSALGETAYWNYNKWLKRMESLCGSIVAADGAIYALRRDLFRAVDVSTVADDFAISTAVVEQGKRLVFENDACVYENVMPSAKGEFGRKVRIINQGLMAVLFRKRLLNPFRYGFYSVVLFSHKILRRFVPFFLLLILATNTVLCLQNSQYKALLAAQMGFYGLAAAGGLLRRFSFGKFRIFYLPFFFCLANAAAMVAVLRLLKGHRIETWQPERHGARA